MQFTMPIPVCPACQQPLRAVSTVLFGSIIPGNAARLFFCNANCEKNYILEGKMMNKQIHEHDRRERSYHQCCKKVQLYLDYRKMQYEQFIHAWKGRLGDNDDEEDEC